MSNWYPSDPEMYEDVQTRWQYENVGTKKSPEKRLQRLWYNSVLNFYRKVIKLRKELSCVRYGNYQEYGKHSAALYTYSREDEKQKILVVCSYSEKEETWKVPEGFDVKSAELILQNYETAESATLKPYETRVYLWNI